MSKKDSGSRLGRSSGAALFYVENTKYFKIAFED